MIYKGSMILVKKLSSEQVLEVIKLLVSETIPEGLRGELYAKYNSEDGVEITFVETEEKLSILN